MSKTLKNRTLILLVLIIISAFLGTSIFNYLSTRSFLRKELIFSSLPLLSENVYSEIKEELTLPLNISSAMSGNSFLINWVGKGESNTEEVVQYLDKIRKEYNFFSTFFVSDQTGNYYYYDGILKQISIKDEHDVWYYHFKNSGKSYDLDVDTDQADNNVLTIFINFRLEDFKGKYLGISGVGIKLHNIVASLKSKEEQYNRRIYLIDESGLIQVHSDENKIEQVSIFDQVGIKDVAAKLMMQQEGPVNAIYETQQGRVFISSRYIPEMNWYIIIEQEERTALALARTNLFLNLIMGLLTTVLLFILSSITISRFQKKLGMLASTDTLTNAANRREFETRFIRAQYRFTRYNLPMSLILIDIDNFKAINDELGHLMGDSVLKNLSIMVEGMIRPDDLLVRWGGDEFVILLESDIKEAAALAERLRNFVSSGELKQALGLDRDVTISIGVSNYIKDETIDDIIARVDKALYESKVAGKNRVTKIIG